HDRLVLVVGEEVEVALALGRRWDRIPLLREVSGADDFGRVARDDHGVVRDGERRERRLEVRLLRLLQRRSARRRRADRLLLVLAERVVPLRLALLRFRLDVREELVETERLLR